MFSHVLNASKIPESKYFHDLRFTKEESEAQVVESLVLAGLEPKHSNSRAVLMASVLSCPLNSILQRGNNLEASKGYPALNAVGDQHILMNEQMNSRVFTLFTSHPFLLSFLRIMENLNSN